MEKGPSLMAFLERSSIGSSWMKNLYHWTTALCIAGLYNSQYVSGTIFDKYTTYQGRGMGIRKISKENEDMSENNKTETQDSIGREFLWILKSTHI